MTSPGKGGISPLDDRYRHQVDSQLRYFSEQALMAARCRVELRYLLALDAIGIMPPLSTPERQRVQRQLHRLDTPDFNADFSRIKAIEAATGHDVKAVELFLRESLDLEEPNRIHLGLTSEDINNLAWSSLLMAHLQESWLPAVRQLMLLLLDLCQRWKNVPFPTRTHGQPASPSTAGKELAVFLDRLLDQYVRLRSFRFAGKLNGATGNHSAIMAAFPRVDWLEFSAGFVSQLGMEPKMATTQIEDHDRWAELFDTVRRVNNIVMDLDRDMWEYISRRWFIQRRAPGQVGSSTMPHKVNPINFENSEGNIKVSNALLAMLSDQLCRSRMQRDLSDSTVTRNTGVAMSHSLLALLQARKGLSRVQVDRDRCRADLESHQELLAEPLQTILKTLGVRDPYELLRRRTQSQTVTRESLMEFLQGLDLEPSALERLQSLSVTGYVGAAPRIAELTCRRASKELQP